MKMTLPMLMDIFVKRRYLVALLIACLNAGPIFSQVLEKKISLHLDNVELPDALTAIAKEANVKFVYSLEQIKIDKKISINADSETLREVLSRLLTPHQISYRIFEAEGRITLKREGKTGLINGSPVLVAGIVTDPKGEVLAGVNILIKGTASGTTTGADGRYRIEAGEDDVLIFSFIGYSPIEATVGGRAQIDITLQEDSRNLEEVTVKAGYWEVETKEQTGNISKITAKDISSQPVLNPMQTLLGRMPGVQISQYSGIPGDGFVVQIRGVNSMRGVTANEPLYIIDGIPFSTASLFSAGGLITTRPNPLSSINPLDIESIEVLKDADATAIYGSRGANGVILITTKKGKGGKTKFDFNVYSGAGQVANSMNMLSRTQYLQMRREAFKNDGVTPTAANAPDLVLWDTTRYTDWQKTLLGGTSLLTNAQGSVSGGNNNTQFLIGGGYYRQSTVFPGDFGYQKGSSHFSVNHKMADDKFTVGLTGNFASETNVLPTTDYTALAMTVAPTSPALYDKNGNLNWENGTWSNPMAETRKRYSTNAKTLIGNLTASYQIMKGLRIRSNIGYNFISTRERNITPIASQNPALNPVGSATTTNGTLSTWIAEPIADYQTTLGEGKLTALAGFTFQQTVRDKQGVLGTGYTNDTQLENIAAAAALTSFGTEYSEYKYTAFYGRLNYIWREKYIVNLTGRRDGSSRFGPGNRFANFGAIGAAWVLSNESFLSDHRFGLSFAKLRGSIGLTGSDQIGDYQYLDTYTATQNSYQGSKGIIPTRLANDQFGWEENLKIEGGLDLSFLHDRINFSLSYYRNRSSNQLVGYGLPALTGFTSVQNNFPATVQNTGVEIATNADVIRAHDFKWNIALNVSVPRNLMVSYPNIETSSYANTYQVGSSLFISKRLQALGPDPQTGVYVFADADHNGTISTTLDTQFLKEKAVNYYGGVQNTLSFKGLELKFFFQFVKQTGLNYLATSQNAPGTRFNQPALVMNRWRNPGDVTDIQKFTQSGAASTAYLFNYLLSDAVIQDASFIRLQNVYLGWSLPSAWSNKIGLDQVKVYGQGQNLLTLTDYKGLDPETQSIKVLPPLRVITIGVQLTF